MVRPIISATANKKIFDHALLKKTSPIIKGKKTTIKNINKPTIPA